MTNFTPQIHPKLYDLVADTDITAVDGQDFGPANCFVKNETQQLIRSFKIRGAFNYLLHHYDLNDRDPDTVVITASAGNHGQGVALAAAHLGLQSQIYVPENCASVKIQALQRLGAAIFKVSGPVDRAIDMAREVADLQSALFVHPYDDQAVIDGNASIGYEIAQDCRYFDSVFVPVGGGGLLSGVCAGLAAKKSASRVFGAQLEGCDSFSRSMSAGHVVELPKLVDLADGTAVRTAGKLALNQVQAATNFGGTILVSNSELRKALDELEIQTGIVAETAAGLSYAAMLKHYKHQRTSACNLLAIITGGHRDQGRYQALLEPAGAPSAAVS